MATIILLVPSTTSQLSHSLDICPAWYHGSLKEGEAAADNEIEQNRRERASVELRV